MWRLGKALKSTLLSFTLESHLIYHETNALSDLFEGNSQNRRVQADRPQFCILWKVTVPVWTSGICCCLWDWEPGPYVSLGVASADKPSPGRFPRLEN